MFFSNNRRKSGKPKRSSLKLLCISVPLALTVSSCAGGDTTVPIETLKTELATGIENVYTKLESADYESSKVGDGVLDVEDVSAALLKENLFSKVDVGADRVAYWYSRNLCRGQDYDSLLKALKPQRKVFSTAFLPKQQQSNTSEEYVFMTVQLSVFPEVVDTELMNLYQNFSDGVTAVGSTCESTFRNQTRQCDLSKVKLSLPNWWNEEDLKASGCEIGDGKTEVSSKVSQVEFDLFDSPFLISQISSKDRGRILARSVVVLPQRTLKTVFVLEVTAVRNGLVNSASDTPSLRDVASNATNVAATLTTRWAETIRQEFDLTSLMVKDLVILEKEN
jgi:hypothetical protein